MVTRAEKFVKWIQDHGLYGKYSKAVLKAKLWHKADRFILRWFTSEAWRLRVSTSLFLDVIEPLVNFCKDQGDYWDKQNLEIATKNVEWARDVAKLKTFTEYWKLDKQSRDELDADQANAMKTAAIAIGEMMDRRPTE